MSEITRNALPATWLDVVAGHAQRMGDRIAYRFLEGGEAETATLTFGQVDRHARAIAQRLIEHGAAGQRVVLAHPPGLEFVAAFFGCLYAGAVAVPTFPARSGASGQRFVSRLHAILADATPVLIATTAATAGRVAEVLNGNAVRVIATDDIDLNAAHDWQHPAVTGDTLACLQYTSGTSGTPKGVMLTHAAMLANSRQIAERFNSTQDSRGVIWLPPYHDMGLIGGVLQPMYVGFDVVLMPPAAFLQRPFRWMNAISKYKATISGGPCFAFGQTARSISDADFATLDLSSWSVAFTGAERVRAETLSEFAERFGAAKFNAKSFLPCYGMAEATLMISGVRQGAGLSMTDGHVSCGPAAAGTSIAIIDQTTGSRVAHGSVGEIWTYGPSVAAGYWKQPQSTADTFAATPKDQSSEYLRTGDLGFMKDGELFVTGRLKELIILRGTNFYPQDIEQTAEAAHGALQPDGSAAFSIDGPAGERLVLVHELRRTERHACPATVVSAVRTKVTADHGIEVGVVALVGPGQVPRTVSGKIQRTACRDLFLAGKLETIDVSELAAPAPAAATTAFALANANKDLPGYLAAKLAAVVGVNAAEIDTHQPVAAYGIGSADAVAIAGQISNELNIDLPAMALWDYPTLAELAGYVAELLATPPAPAAEAA